MASLTATSGGSPRSSQTKFLKDASLQEPLNPDVAEVNDTVDNELHVGMSVRADRMIAGALFVAAALVTTMAVLHGGRVIHRFEDGLEEKKRKSTLESYNSHSGAIVSAFQYPIEMVAGILLSVMILTFAKPFVLVSNPSYETRLGVMAAGFGMAYVLASGLSSMNIELIDDIAVVHMNTTDLVAPTILNEEHQAAPSSYASSWSEHQPENAITNTILRTAIRAFKMRPPPTCTAAKSKFVPASLTTTFGFRQSTWQSEIFERALPQEQDANASFKIYMNTTKQREIDATQPHSLPMDMATATNLFANSLMFTYSWVKWWDKGLNYSQVMEDKFTERFGKRSLDEIKANPRMLTATEAYDLAPPADSKVDPVDWFVNRSRSLIHDALAPQVNVSYIASSIEFKRLKLSDEVTMDAITYELPMWKGYLNRRLVQNGTKLVSLGLNHSEVEGKTNRTDKWEAEQEARTVYYELNTRDDCGPNVPACAIESKEYAAGAPIIPEQRIRAIGVCLNEQGTEALHFTETVGTPPGAHSSGPSVMRMPACKNKSENSFHISGFSYRIVGDAMINQPPPGVDSKENPELTSHRATLVNPRKIYTLTIARISWKPVDLSKKFHVKCDKGEDCMGLSLPLDPMPDSPKEHLVVSQKRLPLKMLQPYAYEEPYYGVQFVSGMPLVAVPVMSNMIGTVFADQALSHNFKKVEWANNTMKGDNCSRWVERALMTTVDNHYYMEGTVQPVYTTAFFFLFQHAAIREEVTDDRIKYAMLKTENVVKPVDVVLAVPTLNAIVTICGSAVLLLGCLGVWYLTNRRPDLLQQQLPADMTVQVLTDDGTYPSFLLQKTVMTRDKGRVIGEGNDVTIDRVGLRAQHPVPPV